MDGFGINPIRRNNIFLFFTGSLLVFAAYFFLRTTLYSILTSIGGLLMLAPLLTRFSESAKIFKTRIGKLAIFTILFSGGILGLKFIANELYSDGLIISDLYQFSLAMLFLVAGSMLHADRKSFSFAIVCYGLAISVGGFFLMKYQGGGLNEVSASYTLSAKNSICVAWAIAGGALLWNYFYGYSNKLLKWCGLGAFFLVCVCILYGRGRTAFLALVLFSIAALYKKFGKGRWYLGIPILLCFGLLLGCFLYFWGMPQLITESFLKNKDEEDLNDVTSGRLDLVLMGIEGFFAHPLWGNGDFNGTMPIHCYPVRIIAGKGLIGGFGYMLFYFYLCKICLKKISEKASGKFEDVGVYLMIVPLVDSLGEITQPYGPGSVSGIAFALLGMYIKKKSEEAACRSNWRPFVGNDIRQVPPPTFRTK